jgi:hypothetical protein
MARSIFGTIGLALTLAFALPVAYLGVEFLLDGRTNQGLLFLGLAALMIGINQYVTTPLDLPGEVAGKLLGTAVKEPDQGDDRSDADASASPATDANADADDDASASPTTDADDAGGDGSGADEDPLIPDAEGGD